MINRGKAAQAAGKANEEMVEQMLTIFRAESNAYWRKTNPMVKNLGPVGKGAMFKAVYAAKGMPDYLLVAPVGYYSGPQVVMFDAKGIRAKGTTTIKGEDQRQQMLDIQATGAAAGGFLVRWYYESTVTALNEWRWHPCQRTTLEAATVTKVKRGNKRQVDIRVVRINRGDGILVESLPTFTPDTPGQPILESFLAAVVAGTIMPEVADLYDVRVAG